MAKMTPTEEAQYALAYGSERSSLSPAAQAEFDRLAEIQRKAGGNQAREQYLASPVGQAETAYQAGQAFFLVAVNTSEVEGKASDCIGRSPPRRSGSAPPTFSGRSKRSAGILSTSVMCSWRPARPLAARCGRRARSVARRATSRASTCSDVRSKRKGPSISRSRPGPLVRHGLGP